MPIIFSRVPSMLYGLWPLQTQFYIVLCIYGVMQRQFFRQYTSQCGGKMKYTNLIYERKIALRLTSYNNADNFIGSILNILKYNTIKSTLIEEKQTY